ncbi:MAG: FKBP-type peptidyl-prolyl cis-trans isomerase, partial [Ardenticatenaceae bacterium]
GLKYEDVVVGEGEEVEVGDLVQVHYTGWLENGTQFDSSVDRGEPFSVSLGAGGVIEGWDEGLQGMRVGGKRTLVIPPELGYGPQGSGGVIPPDATLIFEVEVLGVEEQPEPTTVEEYETTEGGVQYAVLEEGDGAVTAQGDMLTFDFSVWSSEGVLMNSSTQAGQPAQVPLGQTGLPALDEGIAGMKVGEKRQLVVPDPNAAQSGSESTLIFEVELLDVKKAPELSLADEYTTTESGLEYAILEEGEGAAAKTGDTVTMQYSGWLEDGTLFDSSVQRGQPFPFTIGQGQVIAGWDEGVVGMKVGEKRQLRVPPDLAYGEQGSPPTIPPNSTLIFDVELVEIQAEE